MGKPTKAETVARELAAEITGGLYPPGAALDEAAIAARYRVSRTPIREAIRQLTADGIVQTRTHRGAVVRDLSERELDELFAVMAELEALCARWSALAMTTADGRALAALHRDAEVLVARSDHRAYLAANDRFHEAVYAGARNACLDQLTRQTRVRVAPFRRAQFEAPGRLAASHREHGRVLDAILARDPDGAYAAMRAHLSIVRTAVDRLGEAEPVPG